MTGGQLTMLSFTYVWLFRPCEQEHEVLHAGYKDKLWGPGLGGELGCKAEP